MEGRGHKKCLEPPKVGRERRDPPQTPRSQASSFQTERIRFCCSQRLVCAPSSRQHQDTNTKHFPLGGPLSGARQASLSCWLCW